MDLQDQLKKRINQAGCLNMSEIARRSGVNKATLSLWLVGKQRLSARQFNQVGMVIFKTITVLLTGGKRL